MPTTSLPAVPISLAEPSAPPASPVTPTPNIPDPSQQEAKVASYVVNWRNKLRNARQAKTNLWNECWELYRGLEDFTAKEDWQSQIVLPKAWTSIKRAVSVIKRLLSYSNAPGTVEAVNPDDVATVVRAGQWTDLTKFFLDKANYRDNFAESLECSFIIGLGVMKMWWGLVARPRMRIEEVPSVGSPLAGLPMEPTAAPMEPSGVTNPIGQLPAEYDLQQDALYPTQLPAEALSPSGWGAGIPLAGAPLPPTIPMNRNVVREEVLEGQLIIQPVDPYNFYWLPGSKLNEWTGTIEEIELPYWELLEMANKGYLDKERVKKAGTGSITEEQSRANMRFNEPPVPGQQSDKVTGTVKLTEFYGPLILDDDMVERYAHVIVANDTVCLFSGGYRPNPFWDKKPPYVGFSPLVLPFRTEGVGLVEMSRKIIQALSQLANLSIDTLMFRLLPVFEVNLEVFENKEDFETGLTPGKLFQRSVAFAGQEGIKPIAFEDVSAGAVQVSAQLDREHQAASLVSEIQEGIPRYRGVQTATEIQEKAGQQESFFGGIATDIERQALKPMIEMAMDRIMQFIDTINDPRVAGILGVGAEALAGMSKGELLEAVVGDYVVKAGGIADQLAKAEMLQSLVQFMNLIGQNPEAWLPYIRQDVLLQRILEAFRPAIHDIENIIATPDMVQQRQAEQAQAQITPDFLRLLPQLVQLATQPKEEKKKQ